MRIDLFGILTLAVLFSLCSKKKTDATSSATQKIQSASAAVYTALVVKGNVAWSSDDSRWEKLEVQKSVAQGSYVETGKNSGTTLQGSIGDLVQMGEQAKVQLLTDELLQKGERVSLAVRAVRLFRGKAKFSVGKGKGKFTVETPSVRVQVKGTVFTVFVDSTGKTEVAVIEGAVDVIQLSDTSKTKELKPGEVLRGSGDNPTIETLITNDTIVSFDEETIETEDLQQSVETNNNKIITEKTASVETAAIKKRLTPTPGYHSEATEQAGIIAAQKIAQERQAVEQNIEKQKSEFIDKKEAIETEHAAMKAAAEQVPEKAREKAAENLDNERAKSDNSMNRTREEVLKKMQKERASTNEPSKISGGSKNSEDAFDELKRRRGE